MKKTTSKNKAVIHTTSATPIPVVAATTTTPVVRGTKVRAKNKVKDTKVMFHKGLEHRFGFSIAAVRDTMNQLKTLGLPTGEVKKQLIQRFTDYVNQLDK